MRVLKFTIRPFEGTIVDGVGSKKDIQGRIAQIKAQIEETSSDYDHEKLQERLAKLSGGIAVLRSAVRPRLKSKSGRTASMTHRM